MARTCMSCQAAEAVACQECMRAIALMFFGGISRHPEAGTDCQLCEAGAVAYCGDCFVSATVDYRRALREQSSYRDIRVGRDISGV